MHRRRDIQGLRAIAVLVVVLFHAGLGLPGGFVGVDVFFVISGYVITAMLARERESTGRIRFGAFYLRRFKRLTPALALVVLVTVLVGGWLLSPLGPQQTAAKTGLGAMLISANLVISRTTGGYFDAPAEGNPLLHTWSLSVEEQFYLVFPLLLTLGWAWAAHSPRLRHVASVLVGLVAASSFGLTFLALDHRLTGWQDALLGFYGPVTRAWEFAVGALLVLLVGRVSLPARVAPALGVAGALTLAYSLVGISESTPFPGPWTLVPVAGAAALLVAGQGRASGVSWLLATRPMVLVGDWSYSIYLWHWPFIVFAHVLWPGHDSVLVLAALVSLLPAVASYYLLEGPVRRLRGLDRRALAGLVAAVVVPGLLGSAGVLAYAEHVEAPRLAVAGAGRTTYEGEVAWRDHDYRFGGFEACASKVLRDMAATSPNYEVRCQQSQPGPDIDVALVGDSHVEHLFIGLKDALPDLNIMYFTANAPLDLANGAYAAAVDAVNQTPGIRTVIVTSYWHYRGVQAPQVTAMLESLSQPGRRVALTDDVPDFPFDPFGCKYDPPGPATRACTEDAAAYWAGYQPLVDQLGGIVAQVPGSVLVPTAHYLCGEQVCSMTRGHEILYADPSHLNVLGSEYVGARIVEDNPDLFAASS